MHQIRFSAGTEPQTLAGVGVLAYKGREGTRGKERGQVKREEEKGGEGTEYPPKGNPDRALTFDYKSNYIFHPPSS